jgi:hypothetical protein
MHNASIDRILTKGHIQGRKSSGAEVQLHTVHVIFQLNSQNNVHGRGRASRTKIQSSTWKGMTTLYGFNSDFIYRNSYIDLLMREVFSSNGESQIMIPFNVLVVILLSQAWKEKTETRERERGLQSQFNIRLSSTGMGGCTFSSDKSTFKSAYHFSQCSFFSESISQLSLSLFIYLGIPEIYHNKYIN